MRELTEFWFLFLYHCVVLKIRNPEVLAKIKKLRINCSPHPISIATAAATNNKILKRIFFFWVVFSRLVNNMGNMSGCSVQRKKKETIIIVVVVLFRLEI